MHHTTDWAVRQMTGDLLIDEKILATAHISLGRVYTECGGVNSSAVHGDVVKDLRRHDSSLRIDNEWFIRNGVVQPVLTEVAVPRLVSLSPRLSLTDWSCPATPGHHRLGHRGHAPHGLLDDGGTGGEVEAHVTRATRAERGTRVQRHPSVLEKHCRRVIV